MASHPSSSHSDRDAAPAALRAVYGLTLASDFPFSYPLARGRGPADLRFACRPDAPAPDFWEEAECVYASHAPNGERSGLHRLGDREALRFLNGRADFYLQPERITCHLRDATYEHGVEVWLLGTALAYWLERRGVPVLHASAVATGGRAAAFLASKQGGKTSLAAALMQEAGCSLLTDDLLPLDVAPEGTDSGVPQGRPGYPQMRMWPDQAAHFTGQAEQLERVVSHLDKRRVPVGAGGLGTFASAAAPLGCLYLPKRRAPEATDTRIVIEPLAPQEALIALVRHAFLPNLVEAAGLQPQRLSLLAQVARRVPVRRLSYPSGNAHLPRVCQALLEDVAAPPCHRPGAGAAA